MVVSKFSSDCLLRLIVVVIVVISDFSKLSNAQQRTDSDIFSSTTELVKLSKYEEEVVASLQEYAEVLAQNLKTIHKYIDDYNVIKKEQAADTQEVVANPFNAYHLLKRTVVDWENVAESIKNHSRVERLAGEVIRKSKLLPTFEDFVGGSVALVGLQDTYGLNLSEVIHGSIPIEDEKTSAKSPYQLSARDCLFLGKAAFNKGLYDRAYNWLQAALEVAEDEAMKDKITAEKKEILPFLETTKRVHDEVLEKRGPMGDTWQTNPKPINMKDKDGKNRKFKIASQYTPKIYTPITPSEENINFKFLCRDGNLRSPKMDARLRCRLQRRNNSITLIAPFKIEEKSLDPYIVLYHEFMSDAEMEDFRKAATVRLRRSLHQGPDMRFVATDIRTSKQAWLTESDGDFVHKMSTRISSATGLVTDPENEASEFFQVANYGMAGRYTSHTDYLSGKNHQEDPMEIRRGNRVGTFMVYLETVKAGGSTVFPLIGVKVKPRKGTGVFWWNLKRDGQGDPLTRHGACPVLFGAKWIANKWIRYNSQFQVAPCLASGEESASFTTI